MLKDRLRPIKRRVKEWVHRVRVGRPNPLFDSQWYLARYADVERSGVPAYLHYLADGVAEARQPSPAFLARWYVAKYPEVATSGMDPLTHYLRVGAAKGYNPNPVFDTAWYLQRNPDVALIGVNPLLHYLRNGWREGRNPHPDFDIRTYLEQHSEVREAGIEPLGDYLAGLEEGRPRLHLGKHALTAAVLRTLKRFDPVRTDRVCVFLAYAPAGRLRPHVPAYLEALMAAGLKVALTLAVDDPAIEPEVPLRDELSAVFVRENKGFDFGAWAHVLAAEPGFYNVDTLVLANDSMFGPFRRDDMKAILSRVEQSGADVVALTDNTQRGWHLQSYFLAFKEHALGCVAFHRFMLAIQNLETRDEVIEEYELNLASVLTGAGLRCEALFPSAGPENPTLSGWKGLIERGFPFIKIAALRDPLPGVDTSDWREILAGRGYDPGLVDAFMEAAASKGAATVRASGTGAAPRPPAMPNRALRVALIGPWNYATGLGNASRGYASALWQLPFDVNLHAFRKPFHTHARTTGVTDVVTFSGAADLTIVNLNPDAWPSLLDPSHHEVIAGSARRAGLWVWEMAHVPENWFPVFLEQDAVWGMSRYCADVFAAAGASPVDVVPPAVELDIAPLRMLDPTGVRDQLGFARDARIVLYAFDGASYLVRKNPHALVSAFKQSGLGSRGWVLVLKTKNLYDNVEEGGRLAALVAGDPAIRLINRSLNRQDMMALFWAADVYASSHRSEGFGLTVAEAMAAGKVVVATDFGGTRDFLDASCGFPVKAKPAKLEGDFGHYTRGGEWADVDEEDFARALASAAAEVEGGRSAIGDRARQRVRDRLGPSAAAGIMRTCVEAVMARNGA